MCDWEGCTTGTIGPPNPNQRSVAKTSRILRPYISRYIQVYRSGCSWERFSALEGEGITWMGQPSRQGIAPFSVRREFWRRTGGSKTPSLERITPRAMQFCSSRMLPGQQWRKAGRQQVSVLACGLSPAWHIAYSTALHPQVCTRCHPKGSRICEGRRKAFQQT